MKEMIIGFVITVLLWVAVNLMVRSCDGFETLIWKSTGRAPLRVLFVTILWIASAIITLVFTFRFLINL